MSRLSRRSLLLGAGAGALAVGGGALLGFRFTGTDSTGTLLRSRIDLPPPFQRPLTQPPVLAPVESTGGSDIYEITQREATAEFFEGVQTPIWGYEGIFPGPTIVSPRGRTTVVRHRNELPVPAVVHLHGGRVAPEHDGYPTDLILPADGSLDDHHGTGHGGHAGDVSQGVRGYEYPIDQRAATLWYHDHRMDFTAPAVWRGLAGLHLVTDEEERALPLPDGDRDLALVIMDRAFDEDGALRYPSRDPELLETPGVTAPYEAGVLGDVILVNGTPWPYQEVDAVRYRLRLLNGCNARRLRLRLDPAPDGVAEPLVQIASDGGLLERPRPHPHIDLASAERQEVVVDFSGYRPGQTVRLVNDFGSGTTADVLEFRVVREARDESEVPERLSEIERLDPADAVRERDMVFQSNAVDGQHGWTINGDPFSVDRVHAAPALGDIEIWNLYTDFHHPIHLHLVHFQVLKRGSKEPGRFDGGWKDTLDLGPAEQARIITRFDGYRGKYVFHCHNLEHEDMMMMGNFEVR
ncbi:multicopper oxidase domain-containing protein [Streptomyces sp. 3MP-14]|uniref:Multicopper oxidase domain-containing protein n=1 Tax=Streptomyces mimosae TaxID=2586635 RepID=A0A5N6AP82_9ACTN|nr:MULTISPECIES: multicopper oxidase family protein [Streptomyces]KAB8169886.1 multicopper oxidase domain-containing protein [Streptomyces mimosae]KAB8178634.1 multicopper oxidase domain-containing protein [Streptomyces sp. 3MP-14]